jgi:sugar phosphate permease
MHSTRNLYHSWRSAAFTCSWLLYAGYYLCRENQRTISLLPGSPFGNANRSNLLAVFALAYCIGHLVAGSWADAPLSSGQNKRKFLVAGPRRVALLGGLISAFATMAMLLVHTPQGLMDLQLVNGFGQGLGFPALARMLAVWFNRQERAGILAWWSASYSLGGVLAASLTFWCVTTQIFLPSWGWRRSLVLPPVLLIGLSLWFYFSTRDEPAEIGLEPVCNDPVSAPVWKSGPISGWWSVLACSRVRTISAMYFFLKMTRYALLFWLPLYLVQTTHVSAVRAGASASFFELFGFAGALYAVYLSSRFFSGRRFPVAALMLFAVSILALLEPVIALQGWLASAVNITAMGMLVYGVDALMVSVAVLESVPLTHAARSIAVVNGCGSIGQMLAPLLVNWFAQTFGWENLFNLFLVTSLIAAVIVAPRWNDETGDAPEEMTRAC